MAARDPEPGKVHMTLEFETPVSRDDIRQRCAAIAEHMDEWESDDRR